MNKRLGVPPCSIHLTNQCWFRSRPLKLTSFSRLSWHRPSTLSLHFVDWGERPSRTPHEALQRLQAEAMRPFDLSVGPLFRAILFRAGTEKLCSPHGSSEGFCGALDKLIPTRFIRYGIFMAYLPPMPDGCHRLCMISAGQRYASGILSS